MTAMANRCRAVEPDVRANRGAALMPNLSLPGDRFGLHPRHQLSCVPRPAALRSSLVVAYAFAHVLPIPGLDKATEGLFKSSYFEGQGAWWLAGFGFLSAVVKTGSFVLLFLSGLGLRNQFKFK